MERWSGHWRLDLEFGTAVKAPYLRPSTHMLDGLDNRAIAITYIEQSQEQNSDLNQAPLHHLHKITI